ncbi:MAG TPA: HEAT repeat domain-containing protein [Patescibacteria group bacterium]|nr:HEAT repeat domain-containing protein [Patescibacteria group bacterium]
MNAILAKICALLKSVKPETQMAAAVILGELAPRDPSVIKALSAALGTGTRAFRLTVLETLSQVASAASVPDLLPLLESPDDDVRDKAARALIRIGPSAIKPIARQMLDASPVSRRGLIAVLARVKTADSISALMSLVGSGHPEAAREAAQALVTLSHTMSRAETARLRIGAEKVLKVPVDKAPAGSLSAALQVMISVGQPGNASGLTRLLGARYPEPVRRDALLAIAGVLKTASMPMKILSTILPIIQEGPSPALRSAAIETLSAVELPPASVDSMIKLLDNRDPAVRRFVARKLADKGLSGPKAARRLVPLLADADPSLRDAAAESLARLPEAAPLLMEELLACDDIHRGWVLAHVLKLHVSRMRKPIVRQVFDKAVVALTVDDRIWEPMLYVVRHHDPKIMYAWLMDEAARFKKARKYTEAEACLRPLTRGDHFDSEARYELALAGIRAARSRGGISSSAAFSSIDLFKQLVRDPAFPLLDRLKKERTHLQADDLYYLGFHLAEGTPSEREIGAELLKLVAARAGATKLGKSARNKLRAEGLAL